MTSERRVALVVAPFRRRSPRDRAALDLVICDLLAAGWVPVFLPFALKDYLDDLEQRDRGVALASSRAFVATIARDPSSACFVVAGRTSEGMALDIQEWVASAGAREPVVIKPGEVPPRSDERVPAMVWWRPHAVTGRMHAFLGHTSVRAVCSASRGACLAHGAVRLEEGTPHTHACERCARRWRRGR